MVALYLNGKSLRYLCAYLDAEGIPTRRGGSWVPKTLSDVLRNPVPAGRQVDGKGRTLLEGAADPGPGHLAQAAGRAGPEGLEEGGGAGEPDARGDRGVRDLRRPDSGLVFLLDGVDLAR